MMTINKTNYIHKVFFFILLTLVLSLSPVRAEESSYGLSDIRMLTDHLFQEKMINFDDPEQFKEYAIIEDCEIYQEYFNNDFEWNRIRLAVKEEIQNIKPSSRVKKVRVPGTIEFTRYNFTTQSFDLHEDSVFGGVGFIQITESKYDLCDEEYSDRSLKKLPYIYFLKPEIPFNLYRVPVSKVVAQKVLDRTIPNADETRTIYIDINVTLDAFFEVKEEGFRGYAGYVLGSVDSIDFFTDQYREDKFKTLYYDIF